MAEESAGTGTAFALPPPRFLPRRYKPRNVGEWTGHLTFASELIAALQPHLIVELGTHWGEAYFSFCQTVQEQGLPTMCYAVDHWFGDAHAGPYGEEVFDEVSRYNDRFYRHFSYLLRRSFDEALVQFGDGSIDLLHIDGLHTYQAVTHDFRSWLPKVKPGGIILLHDLCPRHQDFGVWRLWEELKAEFPDTFEFHHSWGLGVVRKPGETRRAVLIDSLFNSSAATQEAIRRHYVTYASHLERLLGRTPPVAPQPEAVSDIRVEVYPAINGQHSVEVCQIRTMKAGVWDTLAFDLRNSDIGAPFRIDPGYLPALIEVGDIEMHSVETGELIWSLAADGKRDQLQLGGTAVACPAGGPLILSLGEDPQLLLMTPPEIRGPLKLTINLKVQPSSKSVITAFHDRLQTEVRAREHQLGAAAEERVALISKLDATKAQLDQVVVRQNHVENRLSEAQKTISDIENSFSWRLTAPMRQLMAVLRHGPEK